MSKNSYNEEEYEIYPSIFRRAIAYLIDIVILIVLFSLIRIYIDNNLTNYSEFHQQYRSEIRLTFAMVWILYSTILCSSSWQATIGKRIMGLHVLSWSGNKPSFISIFFRFSSWWVMSMGLKAASEFTGEESISNILLITSYVLSIIWIAIIYISPYRVAVHDILCKTIVVKGKPAETSYEKFKSKEISYEKIFRKR